MAEDTEFMQKFKKTEKEDKAFLRATILKEADEYIKKVAVEEFGLFPTAKGMAISKLVLIAKNCREKEYSKK